MGFLLRLYFDALLKGNPLVVAITIIGTVALAMGSFQEGLSRRDPAAIALVSFVVLCMVVVLAIALVDRRLNPPQGKRRKSGRSKR